MTYPYPSNDNYNASLGIGEFMGYINEVTNYWFGRMTLLAIWFVLVAGFYKARDDIKGALVVGSGITFLISVFFWIAEVCTGWEVLITAGLTIMFGLVLLTDQ